MTRKEWVRRMSILAAVSLLVGLALMITGSIMAGASAESPMVGIALGMGGVVLLTAGGLFWKFAIAGPYPRNLEAQQ